MSTHDKQARDAVILGAARTPSGKLLGALSSLPATQLGAIAIRAAVERAGIDSAQVDEVMMGQVVQAGAGQAPARQAGIHGGLPEHVGTLTLNKVCGSGLKTGMLSAGAIRAGDGDLYVAGGMESMSQAPYLLAGARSGMRFGNSEAVDANVSDALWCSFNGWMMGLAAEFIAEQFEITREAMDEFAYHSHRKAAEATESGRFRAEITPVEIKGRKGKVTVVDTDEPIRADTSIEVLAKLRPAFKEGGLVTAGNAPSVNDGAAALVFASREYAEANGHTPLARVVGYAQAAVDPTWLFHAPAVALPKLLDKVGWALSDADLIEANEAFAAQVLANARHLKREGHAVNMDALNVNGGAIALGHPVGASGARVLVTLLYALQDRGLKRGIAVLCLGGGEAVAMAIEVE